MTALNPAIVSPSWDHGGVDQWQADWLKGVLAGAISMLLTMAVPLAVTQQNRDEDQRRSDALIQLERVSVSVRSASAPTAQEAMGSSMQRGTASDRKSVV